MIVSGQKALILAVLREQGGAVRRPNGECSAAILADIDSIPARSGIDRVTQLLREMERDRLVIRSISGRRTYEVRLTPRGRTVSLIIRTPERVEPPRPPPPAPTHAPVAPGYYLVRAPDRTLHAASAVYVRAHHSDEIVEGPFRTPVEAYDAWQTATALP